MPYIFQLVAINYLNTAHLFRVFEDQFIHLPMRQCLRSSAVQTNDALTTWSVVFQITLSGISGSADFVIVNVL